LSFVRVDHVEGEADVNQDVVADGGLGRKGQRDLFADAAEIDGGAAQGGVGICEDVDDFTGTADT